MDKPTSIIGALNAGKLPSTQQFNQLIDHLSQLGLVQRLSDSKDEIASATGPAVQEVTEALSAQGKVLADDLRDVLSADRKLLNEKNGPSVYAFLRSF